MNVIFVKNYGLFWLRISIRILSLLSAFIVGKFFNTAFFIYAYFATSLLLDILLFKVIKLKESNFKRQGYFEKKFNSSAEYYDQYTHSVINAKLVAFVLAHLIIFIPFKTNFEGLVMLVSGVYGVCLTAIVFRYGFKYGYHKLKAVSEEEARDYKISYPDKITSYESIQCNSSPFIERRPSYGLSGWSGAVYTGNPHDIGT